MTITSLALSFLALTVSAVMFSLLVGAEERRGQRLVLSGVRARTDRAVEWTVALIASCVRYIDRHIIRLSWYYSLHSLLQAALRVVVSLYDYLEQRFHSNRKRARAIRAERRALTRPAQSESSSMLTSVAEHKETTALSAKEKQKLKNKKLERG